MSRPVLLFIRASHAQALISSNRRFQTAPFSQGFTVSCSLTELDLNLDPPSQSIAVGDLSPPEYRNIAGKEASHLGYYIVAPACALLVSDRSV